MNQQNCTTFDQNFYECKCPHLHRGLPFRAEFEQEIVHDILQKFSSTTHCNLTYVSQGPGGFLSDIKIIMCLAQTGYKTLDLIFIEPLYERNADILHACLAVKTWCKENSRDNRTITPYFYKTIANYAHACEMNEVAKGDIFITIDPDDKKTIPNFSSLYFRKKMSETFKAIMNPTNTFYYLYFQRCGEYNYRHMLIGEQIINHHDCIIKLQHSYGEKSLYEYSHIHLFLNNTPVYPCNTEKNMLQVGRKIIHDAQLASLFQIKIQIT